MTTPQLQSVTNPALPYPALPCSALLYLALPGTPCPALLPCSPLPFPALPVNPYSLRNKKIRSHSLTKTLPS
ncbi:hypothetical protein E2C01_073732 [Portunus trituberculatus]|uniref:Uncharacterized protein n=1 Tax=Portunus trituberculatus TaxID=210409 RepID=A0A5B7IBD8_PORTR|nr:hypothetical protein [Portunus trituberculatus]